MKKYILSLLAITTILFSACKKDNANNPAPNESGAYQPFTAGSTWSYRNETAAIGDDTDAEVEITVNTMTDATKVYNGKTFYKLTSVTGGETESTYLNFTNHVYYNYSFNAEADMALELPYLNDELAVSDTWTVPIVVAGAPESQIKGIVAEKGITKTILGKTYNNVIHNKLELQSKLGGVFTTIFTFDFYVAKNIGVIAIYTRYDDTPVSKSELINHNIK
ncbi:hypothetical protein [Mucilaginibacter psychrotolerans]|uniref:Uncharacterized protein n=1 Tax=Mucilaginibacter psychrotolerans TaxID=1524096 RepID=A0A4Y8S8G8_9SPHI|nr:hypothetical protein [Mucilaginibacter psychrotolerans]TFF35192.1 hypothetical protein E2R66_19705 [Mucilaginibacter psychrotolerans]